MSIQHSDTIADLITRIRNAIAVGKTDIRVPMSRLQHAVAEGLVKANYLDKVEVEPSTPRNLLHITINQPTANSRITEITKISTPGRRVYVASTEIPKVKSGRGIALISTNKGIMTGSEARKNHLGGELLLKVY
jgi:small subunit ribosomal protein S8